MESVAEEELRRCQTESKAGQPENSISGKPLMLWLIHLRIKTERLRTPRKVNKRA